MTIENTRAPFVVFEGVAGSGKTTQSRLLEAYLASMGVPVVLNSEPTRNGEFGKLIRAIIENHVTEEIIAGIPAALTRLFGNDSYLYNEFSNIVKKIGVGQNSLLEVDRQLLFIADRLDDLTRVIVPAMENGVTVVQDRYELSTLSYGASFGVGLSRLRALQERVLGDRYVVPQMTFFIGITPKTAIERLDTRGGAKDIYDFAAGIKAIERSYRDIIKSFKTSGANIVDIDGERDQKEVFESVVRAYSLRFNQA